MLKKFLTQERIFFKTSQNYRQQETQSSTSKNVTNITVAVSLPDISCNVLINLEKVFAKYNKFAPPSRDVIIDLKIDLIWLNTVQPSTSYYDASFNWRVKWQDKRVSWSNTSSDISYIGKMISHRNLMVYIM